MQVKDAFSNELNLFAEVGPKPNSGEGREGNLRHVVGCRSAKPTTKRPDEGFKRANLRVLGIHALRSQEGSLGPNPMLRAHALAAKLYC